MILYLLAVLRFIIFLIFFLCDSVICHWLLDDGLVGEIKDLTLLTKMRKRVLVLVLCVLIIIT